MITCQKFPLRLKTASAIVLVSIAMGGLAGCGGGSDTPARPVTPPLVGSSDTTGSVVLSWFAQVADSLYEVALGVASVLEGNVPAGVSEFAAAGLGLISKGLESDSPPSSDEAQQLTTINGQLSTLISNVATIETQLTTVQSQIAGFEDTYVTNLVLGAPMANAKSWLTSYYTDPTNAEGSRAWVSWKTAGCDATPSTCSAPPYPPVTAASLAAFTHAYVKNPANNPMTSNTDNFPLWWAYGVVTDVGAGPAPYSAGGFTASQISDSIFSGITGINATALAPSGLLTYMQYLMTLNSATCGTDMTMPACDLYNNIYLPMEGFFQVAIGRQAQLEMALIEAKQVLGQYKPDSYGSDAKTEMNRYIQYLNQEVEVFLQVAEQIALYRAADGQTDWSDFGSTDAARLLARADFVATQLAGQYYRTASTTPAWTSSYINPPWPSSGVVGRVFYANGEPVSLRHSVCANTDTSCSSPLAELGGPATPATAATPVTPAGIQGTRTESRVPQPYLIWTASVSPTNNAQRWMAGTANTVWQVQRLAPLAATALPAGQYLVASGSASALPRMPATLGVNTYDENFSTPPGPNTNSVIPFGSFNSVEGDIGRYGLNFALSSFPQLTESMPSVVYKDAYGPASATPAAMAYSVRYLTNPYYQGGVGWSDSGFGGVGTTQRSWSASVPVVVTASAAYPNVKVIWPSVFNVNLNSTYTSTSGLGGNGCGRTDYYSYVTATQQILDGSGQVLPQGTAANTDCSTSPFSSCQFNNTQSIGITIPTPTTPAGAQPTLNLTLKASFATEVDQYDRCNGAFWSHTITERSSISPSTASWTIQAPAVALTK